MAHGNSITAEIKPKIMSHIGVDRATGAQCRRHSAGHIVTEVIFLAPIFEYSSIEKRIGSADNIFAVASRRSPGTQNIRGI